MASDNAHNATFKRNLEKIKALILEQKQEIRDLKKENARMKAKMEDMVSSQTDIFSEISERERMALKQQIGSIIEKIDQTLGGTNEVN